jgi:hypothetical protein
MRLKRMQFLVIALLAVSLVLVSVVQSDAGYYRRGHWGHYPYYRPFGVGVGFYHSPFYGYPVGYYPYYGSYYYPHYYRPYVNVGVPFFYPFLPGISFHFGF